MAGLQASRPSRASFSAAAHLIAYGAAIMLPFLIALGVMIDRSFSLERQKLESHMLQIADALAADVDRDIDRRIIILRTLATSPLLTESKYEVFYEQAKVAMEDQAYVILIDLNLRQILNTLVPYGSAPARTGDPPTALRAIETRKSQISDLFVSRVTGRPAFNVNLPILNEHGEVKYVLILGFHAQDLLGVLAAQRLAPGWTSTIVDRKGVVLARSRDAERFVGRALPDRLRSPSSRIFSTTNVDDEKVLRATAVSAISGWQVAVNAPLDEVNEALRRTLWLWSGVGIGAVILAIGLGILFGRALTRPLADVAASVAALGRGDRIDQTPSLFLTEARLVTAALRKAQDDLERRTSQLRESEQRLRDAADAAAFGMYEVDVPRGMVNWSRQLREILDAGPDENVPLDRAQSFVHPGDRERVSAVMDDVLRGERDPYEMEFRIVRGDGTVRWIMDRGRAIKGPAGAVARVIGVLIDITPLKLGEARQQMLIDELNHRIKNTLAVVQSIARQTLRNTPNPREFETVFSARLASLASVHGLLAERSWQGVPLGEIVRATIRAFIDDGRQVEVAGPPVDLPGEISITLALVLHELLTNALKHGALSRAGGVVSIEWTLAAIPDVSEVTLRWTERGGPPVVQPSRRGFGSQLIEASAAQLEAVVTADYASQGFTFSIVFPVLHTGALATRRS
jgi:PAS domain S-box-containing protein